MLTALLLLVATQAAPREAGVPIGSGVTLPKVVLEKPTGGWTVDRMLRVEGSVSDPTIDPVVLSINGDRYLMRTIRGRFSRKFPASGGKNVVKVRATNRAGTASAEVTSYAQIPPVPFKAVLTSDTDGVYTDLHIYEPTEASQAFGADFHQKMAHVYWAQTESPSGGTFFLNEQGGDFDQPGYGPYLYIHRAPPKGLYFVSANYWPSGDKAHTVGTLNLTLFEGTPGELRRTVKVPLATPGTTRVLAWVNVLGQGRAMIYVPHVDPVPVGGGWPDAQTLAETTAAVNSSGTSSGDGEY